VSGAKNSVLPIMASLILNSGINTLKNVPNLTDVQTMITLLEQLGARVQFHDKQGVLVVDTTTLNRHTVSEEIMQKIRASIVVLGPLLARFKAADVGFPGGDAIGARPIDYHLKNFKKMGARIIQKDNLLRLQAKDLKPARFVLDYPSVGATQNIIMASVLIPGTSYIVNAAMEPEVMDVIQILQKMGANISIEYPATIKIQGVEKLVAVEYEIMPDRLEVGALLLAAGMTGGHIDIPNARAYDMELFLTKLEDMGHTIQIGPDGIGVQLYATLQPRNVSFKTAPYPGIATDLQPLIMAAQVVAQGTSEMIETVFENRFLHVPYLQNMGANIQLVGNHKAMITGGATLAGADVVATDIRASCCFVLAGLVADGQTRVYGVSHWRRGYENLDEKLRSLGACIQFVQAEIEG
jgi:UDP-N-acetylglucosamine 1-carboxyvinyltransferase